MVWKAEEVEADCIGIVYPGVCVTEGGGGGANKDPGLIKRHRVFPKKFCFQNSFPKRFSQKQVSELENPVNRREPAPLRAGKFRKSSASVLDAVRAWRGIIPIHESF